MRPAAVDALKDLAIDYIEMCVADLDVTAFAWVDRYGFAVAGSGGSAEHRGIALRHGPITLVLTQATADRHPAAEYVRAHGDGIADITLRTADVPTAFAAAVAGGARPYRRPARHRVAGPAVTATITGFGNVVHTLLQRDPAEDPGLPPGFVPPLVSPEVRTGAPDLTGIDHVGLLVRTGELGAAVEFYRRALGFQQIADRHADTPLTTVVQSASGAVTLALSEPAGGDRHVAFGTADALRAVRSLTARGVDFRAAADGTYASHPQQPPFVGASRALGPTLKARLSHSQARLGHARERATCPAGPTPKARARRADRKAMARSPKTWSGTSRQASA